MSENEKAGTVLTLGDDQFRVTEDEFERVAEWLVTVAPFGDQFLGERFSTNVRRLRAEVERLKKELADHGNCYFGNPLAEMQTERDKAEARVATLEKERDEDRRREYGYSNRLRKEFADAKGIARANIARADKAEAEVERLNPLGVAKREGKLRDEAKAALDLWTASEARADKAEARVAELEKAIKNAPHGRTCNTHAAFQTANGFPCDCWKRSALSPEGKGAG